MIQVASNGPLLNKVLFVLAIVQLGFVNDTRIALAADLSGEELLLQAAAHTGDKVIITGEFRYTLRTSERPPTEESIARTVASMRELLQATLEKVGDNEDERKRVQDSIDTSDEIVKAQMIQNASKTMAYYFVLGGPQLGSDRYVEFSILDPNAAKYRPATVVLQLRSELATT